MTEMLKVMLKEILHIEMGQSPKAENVNIDGRGMPLLNGPAEFTNTNPIPVQFTTNGSRFAEEGEILFCVRGSTTGRMNIADQKYAIGRGLAAISHKNGPEFNSFVKGLIESHLSGLLGGTMGSVFPNINKDQLFNYKCYVPNLNSQQKIAKVLSDLDTKIELNNKINTELETMAKLVYDYWFVQFDFPDKDGRPYKSFGGKMVYNEKLKREIPEGWEVKALKQLIQIGKDQLNPSETPSKAFKHLSIPIFDRTGTYQLEAGKDIGSNKFILEENDIAVSKLNPWFNRVFYPEGDSDLICTTEMVVWKCEVVEKKNFFYQIARSRHFISYCIQSATGTSNSHKRVNPTVMMQYKIPFEKDLVKKFGNTISPWIRTINLNKKENQKLAELRYWLLPMLMNGQIKVK